MIARGRPGYSSHRLLIERHRSATICRVEECRGRLYTANKVTSRLTRLNWKMKLLQIFIALSFIAAPAQGATNARLERLYSMFMSPCCWQQNLRVHQSPIAEQLRRQIETMVQAGFSDEEIKAAFVGHYTKRILAMPEGAEAWWLYLTPAVATTAGLFFLLVQLRRWRRRVVSPFRFTPEELELEWEEPGSPWYSPLADGSKFRQ